MSEFTFRKIFANAKTFTHSDEDLKMLANFMLKEGTAKAASSQIPAGYTYLGQFIAHDISEDSKSDRFNKDHHPFGQITANSIKNLRNPVFDLESVYGFLKNFKGGEIVLTDLLETKSAKLKLADTIPESLSNQNSNLNKPFPGDLPRQKFTLIPKIPDVRNDENLLLAQTQIAFMKFHNAVASFFPNLTFNEIREITIRHYQYIILTDFLPLIVKKTILEKVRENISKASFFYQFDAHDRFLPLEFTAGAYRMGHSMIRNFYNWNVVFKNSATVKKAASITDLFLLTHRGQMRGTGILSRQQLPSIWLINWNWFYNIDNSKSQSEFNFAKKITTNISSVLGSMRPHFNLDTQIKPDFILPQPTVSIVQNGRPPIANSLPALDLFRSRALGLPTGQAVSTAIAEKINALNGFPQVETLEADYFDELLQSIPAENRKSLAADTPLWFYILAEAEKQTEGETLGDTGSWIVAETILKIMLESPFSILKKDLKTDPHFLAKTLTTNDNSENAANKFGMAEMLKFIAKQNNEFDELNPLETSRQI